MKDISRDTNSGFSLVELIVVIAIMVVLAGAAIGVFTQNYNTRLKSSTQTLCSYLDNTQNYCLTKEDTCLTIVQSDRGYVLTISDGTSKMLPKGVELTYDDNAGNTDVAITKDKPLIIGFDRTTGGYKPVIVSVNEGVYTYKQALTEDGATSYVYPKRIIVTASDRSKIINLYTKTGNHKVTDE